MQNQYDPFTIVQQSQNRAAKLTKDFQEKSALDNILSEAMNSNNPDVLQNTLGKILSQVSPEKQQLAMQVVQGKINQIKDNQEKQNQLRAAEKWGYDPYAPPGVQAQQVKDRNKKERLDQYFGTDNQQVEFENMPIQGNQQLPIPQMTNKDQLINLTGHPDKEISEPAKFRLQEIQEIEKENRLEDRDTRKELRKEILDIEKELPKFKSSQQNITRLEELSKTLTGAKGYWDAAWGNKNAAEFNTLGASLLDPVIKIFNPSGALPTAKLNWIKDQFQPKAVELSGTIQGKIATMKRFNDQAIERAEKKLVLFKNYNGIPPQSEILKFDQETEKIANDMVDQGQLLEKMQDEVPSGMILMLDINGNPLHVNPNGKMPNGESQIDYVIRLGGKKV
jgi:hypothetical protein